MITHARDDGKAAPSAGASGSSANTSTEDSQSVLVPLWKLRTRRRVSRSIVVTSCSSIARWIASRDRRTSSAWPAATTLRSALVAPSSSRQTTTSCWMCAAELTRGVDSALSLLRKGSVMTHVCCPSCRLRFTPAAAAYLVACPQCGEPPQTVAGAQRIFGFRLFEPQDPAPALPEALAVSMPVPDPRGTRP